MWVCKNKCHKEIGWTVIRKETSITTVANEYASDDRTGSLPLKCGVPSTYWKPDIMICSSCGRKVSWRSK